MSDFPFCLTKAGQHLLVHVARGPRGMSVERFGKAKEGQPLLTQVRRLLGYFLFCALAWQRQASHRWPAFVGTQGQGRQAVGGPRSTCGQGHDRFALWRCQARPAVSGPRSTRSHGHVSFPF